MLHLVHLNDIEEPWVVGNDDDHHDETVNGYVDKLDFADTFFNSEIFTRIRLSKDCLDCDPIHMLMIMKLIHFKNEAGYVDYYQTLWGNVWDL